MKTLPFPLVERVVKRSIAVFLLRSEEHAKSLMKTVVSIKIKNLAKYEKDWRRLKEAERLAEDPLTRWPHRFCGHFFMLKVIWKSAHTGSLKWH